MKDLNSACTDYVRKIATDGFRGRENSEKKKKIIEADVANSLQPEGKHFLIPHGYVATYRICM